MNPAGSLLVSWSGRQPTDNSNMDVGARRYDGPSGAWAAEARINDTAPSLSKVGAPILYPQGDGAVVFTDYFARQIRVRRLDAAGSPTGDSVQLGDLGAALPVLSPDVAAGPDGTTLVVWQEIITTLDAIPYRIPRPLL